MKRSIGNASNLGGADFTKQAGGVKKKKNILHCGVHHISKLRRELEKNGLELKSASTKTQCITLLHVLQYLGNRGINTKEGEGCGFYRIATRIQELEAEGYSIESFRERIIGADGLEHGGIARYVLKDSITYIDPQGSLDLGGDL